MIIKKLRLENFGVYVGTHEIDLSPSSRDRPIVLFGGLNGGGKTTLLDAIQLALFGKLSRCSTRGNLAYEEFLRRCISHGASPEAGASVSLELRQTFDAQAHEFMITRRWVPNGKGVAESVQVLRDNVVDLDLAENWLEHVDQFVPVGLAELFFFDGEQIARLAESENAAQMLATAINTLLGIDLVDRLEKDLMLYERDVVKSYRESEASLEVVQRETKLGAMQSELRRLTFEKGEGQSDVDQRQKKIESMEADFHRQGGDLFARRKEILGKRDSLGTQIKRVEHDLRELAAGAAPLLMVTSEIAKVRAQASREETAHNQTLLLAEIEKRDKVILGLLKRRDVGNSAQERIESFFVEDRQRRAQASRVECYLELEKAASHSLQRLSSGFFDEIHFRAKKLTDEHRQLSDQLQKIDETLGRVPDEAAIAHLLEQINTAQRELIKRQMELSVLSEQTERLQRQIADEERSLAATMEKGVSEAAERDDALRKLKYAARVRETMKQFRLRVLDRKIRQIEGLILESFQQLLRKKDLVSAIRIDPASYRMSLFGPGGQELHADRLSAGERQLLAVSTLWGLARTSGRPLPTIIDTPLGRLDSKHRSNLVESYFPYASHQVIILSTDEEIAEAHLATLRSRITRTFELAYSPESRSTTVKSGYFFN